MQSRHCAVEIKVVTVMTSKRFLRCIKRCFYSEYTVWTWRSGVRHVEMTTSLRLAIWSASLGAWFIVSGTFLFSTRSLYRLISSRWLSPHGPITHSFCRLSRLLCSSPLPSRSLLHSRSSFIVCFLHIFYLCFRTWRSAFPSSFLQFIFFFKSPLSHWWLHMLWPSFCFQNGAFSSHPPRPLLLSGQPHPKRQWVRIDSLKKVYVQGFVVLKLMQAHHIWERWI